MQNRPEQRYTQFTVASDSLCWTGGRNSC